MRELGVVIKELAETQEKLYGVEGFYPESAEGKEAKVKVLAELTLRKNQLLQEKADINVRFDVEQAYRLAGLELPPLQEPQE